MDPHLVLDGIATRGRVFNVREKTFTREALGSLVHLVCRKDLDPKVIQGSSDSLSSSLGVLNEHELERRLSDREVRVPGHQLRGASTEELGVEVDRGVEIRDVESELDTRHLSLHIFIVVDVNISTTIDLVKVVLTAKRPTNCAKAVFPHTPPGPTAALFPNEEAGIGKHLGVMGDRRLALL